MVYSGKKFVGETMILLRQMLKMDFVVATPNEVKHYTKGELTKVEKLNK